MEPGMLFLLYSILLIAVSMIGAYLPQIGRVQDSRAHLMIALSAGIFLGLLLFILLPEAIEEGNEGGMEVEKKG